MKHRLISRLTTTILELGADQVKMFVHVHWKNKTEKENWVKLYENPGRKFVRKRKLNLPSFSCPYLFSIQFLEIRLDKTNSKQIPWPISYHSILEFKPNKKLSAFGISYTCMYIHEYPHRHYTIIHTLHPHWKWYEGTGRNEIKKGSIQHTIVEKIVWHGIVVR